MVETERDTQIKNSWQASDSQGAKYGQAKNWRRIASLWRTNKLSYCYHFDFLFSFAAHKKSALVQNQSA